VAAVRPTQSTRRRRGLDRDGGCRPVAEAVAVLRGHLADSLVTAGRHTDALALHAKEGRRNLPAPVLEQGPQPHSPHIELGKALAVQPAAKRPLSPAVPQHRTTRGSD
jgi:hypothetical protein